MKLKERAAYLKRALPAVYIALKDRGTPVLAKCLGTLAVCYALSPIDLIPDFIPVLGCLDDLLILPALVALTIRLVPRDVWENALKAADEMVESGMAKSWRYAIPVVLFYVVIIAAAVRVIATVAAK